MKSAAPETWNATAKAAFQTWHADSLRGRFARGAVWSLAGAVVSQGSNLAASIITARLLGREEFGKFGIIQSTVSMLGVFAGAGLGLTATKYVAEFRTRDPERASRIIALGSTAAMLSGTLLSVALFVCAPLLAAKTLNAGDLAGGLRIASLLLFFNAVNGAQTGALSGFEAFKAIASINLMRGLILLPVSAAAVFYGHLQGAIWALAATSAATCLIAHALLRRECATNGIRPSFSSGLVERRVLWSFSTPAFLSSALTAPTIWAASAMLVNQPAGYAEMGVFSVANQWRTAIAFMPGVLSQSALPLLSNLNGEGDTSRYRKALRWNLGLTAVAAAVVAIPVAFSAPLIMRLYGHDFLNGSLVLVLSAATAVLACVNGVVGTAILSTGSVWVGFAFNALWAGVFLATSYTFIPRNLAIGLAGSLLAAYIAHTIWQAIYLRRCLPSSR